MLFLAIIVPGMTNHLIWTISQDYMPVLRCEWWVEANMFKIWPNSFQKWELLYLH